MSFYSSLLPYFLCKESPPSLLLCFYQSLQSSQTNQGSENKLLGFSVLTHSYREGFFHLPIFLLQSIKRMWIHCTKIQRLKKIPLSFLRLSCITALSMRFYWLWDIEFSSLDADCFQCRASPWVKNSSGRLPPGSYFLTWLQTPPTSQFKKISVLCFSLMVRWYYSF